MTRSRIEAAPRDPEANVSEGIALLRDQQEQIEGKQWLDQKRAEFRRHAAALRAAVQVHLDRATAYLDPLLDQQQQPTDAEVRKGARLFVRVVAELRRVDEDVFAVTDEAQLRWRFFERLEKARDYLRQQVALDTRDASGQLVVAPGLLDAIIGLLASDENTAAAIIRNWSGETGTASFSRWLPAIVACLWDSGAAPSDRSPTGSTPRQNAAADRAFGWRPITPGEDNADSKKAIDTGLSVEPPDGKATGKDGERVVRAAPPAPPVTMLPASRQELLESCQAFRRQLADPTSFALADAPRFLRDCWRAMQQIGSAEPLPAPPDWSTPSADADGVFYRRMAQRLTQRPLEGLSEHSVFDAVNDVVRWCNALLVADPLKQDAAAQHPGELREALTDTEKLNPRVTEEWLSMTAAIERAESKDIVIDIHAVSRAAAKKKFASRPGLPKGREVEWHSFWAWLGVRQQRKPEDRTASEPTKTPKKQSKLEKGGFVTWDEAG